MQAPVDEGRFAGMDQQERLAAPHSSSTSSRSSSSSRCWRAATAAGCREAATSIRFWQHLKLVIWAQGNTGEAGAGAAGHKQQSKSSTKPRVARDGGVVFSAKIICLAREGGAASAAELDKPRGGGAKHRRCSLLCAL